VNHRLYSEGLQRKIRELGSLPSDAFEKYRGKALKGLHALLGRALHLDPWDTLARLQTISINLLAIPIDRSWF
jgi:hypothetical protein